MRSPDTPSFLNCSPARPIKIARNNNFLKKFDTNVQFNGSLHSFPTSLSVISQENILKSVGLASVITFFGFIFKRLLAKTPDSINAIGDQLLSTLKIPSQKIELISRNKEKLVEYLTNRWLKKYPKFNLSQLSTFHSFIKDNFSPSPMIISTALQPLILKTNDTNTLCYIMALHDSFVTNAKMYSAHLEKIFQGNVQNALSKFKETLYREHVIEKLDEELAKHAALFPPAPPPITGDESKVAERKRQILSHLSTNSRFLLSLNDNEIEAAARKLAKCTWALDFYSAELVDPKIFSGYNILGLSEDQAREIKKSCIIDQSEKIKNEVMNPLEKQVDPQMPSFVPKFKIVEQCRLDQIRDLSGEIADWQNLLKDTISRKGIQIPPSSKDFYSLDDVPAFKGEIKGGKAVKRDYLPPEHGEESLTYDQLKERMDEADYLMYDKDLNPKFEFTSKEEIEKGVEEAKKILEPYKHMDPEEYLDMFVKNSNTEWKFTMAVLDRKKRRQLLESNNSNINDQTNQETDVAEPSKSSSIKTELKLSKREILADAFYFLSKLEHLKWCYSFATRMPITALETIKQVGNDPDNPPPPSVKFTGPNFKLPREWIKEYLGDINSPANKFRELLDGQTTGMDERSDKEIARDNSPYINDDKELLMKDMPLLAAISATGGQTGITYKFPEPLDGKEVYEKMQQFLPYRLSKEKPNPQSTCTSCGYMIFKLQFKDKSGQIVEANEYAQFEKNMFTCPICNNSKFETRYPTGKAGLSKEAQEAIDEAYTFPEDYEDDNTN